MTRFLSRRRLLAAGLLAAPIYAAVKMNNFSRDARAAHGKEGRLPVEKQPLAAVEIRPDLNEIFGKAGTVGAFVALQGDRLVGSDLHLIREPRLPASSFKVAHSIIAFETGVVSDPDKDILAWDGVERSFPDWNKDQTLRSAIAASAVPAYQQIARRIGTERMQAYMDLLDYGNRDIGGGIDRFWLSGQLRVSPVEQIAFLERLQRRALPVSRRSQDLAVHVMTVTKAGEGAIRVKSGLVGVDDRNGLDKATAGWLIGFAGKGGVEVPFALYLEVREARHIGDRTKLAIECLSRIEAV